MADDTEPPRDFTLDDVDPEDLVTCARYGEEDNVRFLLDLGLGVDSKVSDGSTALHMACANNHESIVRLLLERGAKHIRNEAGNLPAHWAAQNGSEDAMKVLLELVTDFDVLACNQYGRGVLTEALSNGHTDVAALLLAHPSASEEDLLRSPSRGGEDRKLGELAGVSAEGGEEEQQSGEEEMTHEFDFGAGDVRIREKVMVRENECAFGEKHEEDRTGLGVWSAALLLARWLTKHAGEFAGKFVVELGAGCGVSAIALGRAEPTCRLWVSDLSPLTMSNLCHNISLNFGDEEDATRVQGKVIDWQDHSTWPSPRLPDVVVGADLVYSAEIVPLLVSTISGLLPLPGSVFYYCAPRTGRAGMPDFLEALYAAGFGVAEKVEADQASDAHGLCANPLKSQNAELFFVCFQDMAGVSFDLYKFERLAVS